MAHTVTNEYKQVIYSGDSRHKIKILFNNVELQEADRYCERVTIKSRIIPNGAKRFSLNNFISKEVEIILHDIDTSIIQDKVSISIGTLVGNAYEYVPIGIFNIQGTPTTDKNKITIKLRDNSVKFDFNYNAKPLIDEKGGSATKLQILQDICSKANVTCNISSFLGSTDSIGIYDNTITARQYIADIVEQAGRIATINRNGELIFVNLNSLTTWNIPLSIVEKYEIGKAYRIGKVVYEDAIRKYETASTNYDTLYLDSSNPYISSQSQVNSILQQVNNFEIDSVKTGKILGNPAIDGYDIINIYNDKVEGNPSIFKTLATNDLVYNGVLINTFDTQIGEEERKENVSIVGEATFKKWATTSINNINGEIDIQAGKIDNVEKETNPTQDATGTSFYLEDSTNAELVNFELEGKTTQETRSGKNLWDNKDYYTQLTTDNYTIQNNGFSFTRGSLTGGKYIAKRITVESGKTYTFSGTSSDFGTNFYQIIYRGNVYGTNLASSTNGKVTYTATANEDLFFTFIISSGQTSASVSNIQVEVGSSVTSYEQYGAMPSPDYSSELVSVGYENYFEAEYLQTTANTNINANLKKGTYTISLETKQNFGGVIYIQLYKNNTLITTNGHLLNTSSAVSFSTSSYWYYFPNIPNGNKLTFTLDDDYSLKIALSNATGSQKAFLVKGTQEHSYIPYGKYGIEVKTTGKNLLPSISNTMTISGITFTKNIDGSIIINGTATSNALITIYGEWSGAVIYQRLDSSKYYTISGSNNANIQIFIRTTNGTTITSHNPQSNPTFTGQSGIVNYFIQVLNGTVCNNVIIKPQLEENTQVTDYEEYKGKTYLYTLNQPLRSIGDTKDLLYIKNGMLFVERKIGSVVLDENKSISSFSTHSGTTYITANYVNSNIKKLSSAIVACISDKLIGATLTDTWNGRILNSCSLATNGKYIQICLPYSSASTSAELQSWLTANKPIINYELAETTTEELGQVDMPNTYKTITHINTTDGNEPNMNITYVRDTQLTNYVEEHISQIIVNEEGISSRVQTIEDSDYDSRLNAVEQKQTDTDLTIDIISTNIDKTNGEVRAVTTNTGFTFDENGLNIKKSDTDYNTLIDNTGTYYKDGETIISMTNKDGFLAKDFRLQGQHYYSYNGSTPSNPLASENYDFVDERIEVEVDGQTQYAYATFYNGEV